MDLFRQLPCGVQRQARRAHACRFAMRVAADSRAVQVWELEGALFRRHVTPSIFGYAEETATTMRELDMVRSA